MKLQIKEDLRQLAFPEATMMSPPPRKIVNLHKKKSSQPKRNGARIVISPHYSIPTPTRVPKPILVPTTYDPSSPIHYMPKLMRPFIEKIVDVRGNGNCGFRAIAESMSLVEGSHVMVRRTFIREMKVHRNHYMGYMQVRDVITIS
ncbi:hypothetical protein MTR_3g026360 [Medicago truncatula]|uniref:OTU domain-containing protein n=1 Tax=Medicago truncatula TaxID=3880 RepID=A0A072V4R2_MEDTR|nr:hypothetical protein MTR_3g026360 [Medicago truncatula]